MPDSADYMHVLDERTFHIADATPSQRAAAEQYARRNGRDCLDALGFGGRDDKRGGAR